MLNSQQKVALAYASVGCSLGLSLVASAAWVSWLQFRGNFHEVVSGELYRSAQLDGDRLRKEMATHGIRSVLNLRGSSPAGKDWYVRERAVTKENGAVHVDFRMSACKHVPSERISELVHLLETLPRPILVHCKQGADRTGLACALFLARVKRQDPSLARRQLSLRYGHVSLPRVSAAYPMDETWHRLYPEQDAAEAEATLIGA